MKLLPRVSEILSILDNTYDAVPHRTLKTAAERGTALHALCTQHLASMIGLCWKPAEIEAEYSAAYLGFLEWVEAKRVQPIVVEQQGINIDDGYTGTPDALVRYGDESAQILVDLKFTASIIRRNFVQVQAYGRLDAYRQATRWTLVHIDPLSGRWREIPVIPNPRDWIAFKSAISIYYWRQAS